MSKAGERGPLYGSGGKTGKSYNFPQQYVIDEHSAVCTWSSITDFLVNKIIKFYHCGPIILVCPAHKRDLIESVGKVVLECRPGRAGCTCATSCTGTLRCGSWTPGSPGGRRRGRATTADSEWRPPA